MLAGRLIDLIESNRDSITAMALRQIRNEPDLAHFAGLPAIELREWVQEILDHLGNWLTRSNVDELGDGYEALGATRFEEGVPLAEAVRALFILKAKIFDFIEQQAVDGTSSEIYAEWDLHVRLERFFDFLAGHLVAGYEKALRHAANLEADLRRAPKRRRAMG